MSATTQTPLLAGAAHLPSAPSDARLRLWLTALVVLAVWLAIRVLFFEGLHGSDDLYHVRFAYFWHRLPVNHWETRVLYNALLLLSFKLFGFSEISAALPGMLGSLLVLLSGTWLAWYRWASCRTVLLVGMLIALLPIDVTSCTTASATRVLASGFLAAALACMVCRPGRWGVLVGGVCLGLAAWTHLGVLFFVVTYALASALVDRGGAGRAVVALGIAGLVFIGLDALIFGCWTGDPLFRFRIITDTHLSQWERLEVTGHRFHLTTDGQINWTFFWKPATDLMLSKALGLYGSAALLGLLLIGGRAGRRCLPWLLAALAAWAWMSYGSQSPSSYKPFAYTTNYWHPLGLLLVLVIGEFIADMKGPRWRYAALAPVGAVSLLMLMVSGSWGQNIEISKELLAYAETHPAQKFVTDDKTLTELHVLSEFKLPENVHGAPGSEGPKFGSVRNLTDPDRPAAAFLLVNPLNKRTRSPTWMWITEHLGRKVHESAPRYRSVAYFMPQSLRTARPWLIRKPAAEVYRCSRKPQAVSSK